MHSTLVSQEQNDEMRRLSEASLAQSVEIRKLSQTGLARNEEIKKISAWAAILFAPTLIGTIYGMNFTYMPELGWPLGYSIAVAACCLRRSPLWNLQYSPLDLTRLKQRRNRRERDDLAGRAAAPGVRRIPP